MRYAAAVILCFLALCASSRPAQCRSIPPYSRYRVINDRNVFRPLWKTSQKTPEEIAAEREDEEKRRRREAEDRLVELRRQEEANAVEAKKKRIQDDLALTGIVDDGAQLIAFIQQNSQGNRTLMLKKDDTVEDSKIIAIDQENGEVTLEYRNEFTVKLLLKK